jgi:hypothetical protein
MDKEVHFIRCLQSDGRIASFQCGLNVCLEAEVNLIYVDVSNSLTKEAIEKKEGSL